MKPLAALLCVLAGFAFVSTVHADEPASLQIVQTLKLGGEGRWDYLTVDSPNHRLYVTRASHVQVVDLTSGQVVADWTGLDGVHGVAIVHFFKNPTADRAFVSCGKTNSVAVFDLATNKKVADVPVGNKPDAIAYDPISACVLACNHGGGSVTFIPVNPGSDGKYQPQNLDVGGGTLEFVVVDGLGHAYVNVEDKNEVVAIDTKTRTVLAHYPLPGGEGPTGLAIDVGHQRLFVACAQSKNIIILDATNGHVIGTQPMGEHVDGAAFDTNTGRAYASGGDGTLTVLKADGANSYSSETVKTEPGARTIAVDSATGRVYLPTADMTGQGRQADMKKDSFRVLVVGTK